MYYIYTYYIYRYYYIILGKKFSPKNLPTSFLPICVLPIYILSKIVLSCPAGVYDKEPCRVVPVKCACHMRVRRFFITAPFYRQ